MPFLYLGLGSNLGDRYQNLASSICSLKSSGLSISRSSSVYETAPWGEEQQPWFLNLVLECWSLVAPEAIFLLCQIVEKKFGRRWSKRWGPRLLDIDILLFGNLIYKTKNLEIPHPRLSQRLFVLAPLLEINDHLEDPQTGRPFLSYLPAVQGQVIKKFEGPGRLNFL